MNVFSNGVVVVVDNFSFFIFVRGFETLDAISCAKFLLDGFG